MRRRTDHEFAKVVVDEPVPGHPAHLAPLHGTALAEEPELMGERRHAHANDERHVAYAQLLLADGEQVKDASA